MNSKRRNIRTSKRPNQAAANSPTHSFDVLTFRRFDVALRRGAIGVTLIIVLVIVQMLIVAIVLAGGRDQDTTLKRMDSIRAFYAAEGGMNMAIRESMLNADSDGDGTVGSISNDGNSANNPSIAPGGGRVYVTAATASGITTMTSYGTAGSNPGATRKIQSIAGAGNSNNVNSQQIATQATLSSNGTLTTITSYVKGPPPKLLRFGLYTNSAGSPGSLVAQSANVAVSSNAGLYWHTLGLPSTAVTAGTYWVALGLEHSNMYYSYTGSGTTKFNANDPVASGFDNPWGSTTSTVTRQVNIFATVMQTTTGTYDFSNASQYHNSDPQPSGEFRDVTSAAYIVRGNDISSNVVRYSALNFTAGAGVLVSNAYTVRDSVPSNATQTNYAGGIRVQGDLLTTGSGTKYFGFAALHNEVVGQDGIVAVIKKAASDRLEIYRLPQNGDITGASSLATSGSLSLSDNSWYRLVLDIVIHNGQVYVTLAAYTHTTANNPNSSVSATPLETVTYSAALSAITGLQSSGEVAVAWDTTNSTARGSCTNMTIYSSPVQFPSITNTTAVTGWAETP